MLRLQPRNPPPEIMNLENKQHKMYMTIKMFILPELCFKMLYNYSFLQKLLQTPYGCYRKIWDRDFHPQHLHIPKLYISFLSLIISFITNLNILFSINTSRFRIQFSVSYSISSISISAQTSSVL